MNHTASCATSVNICSSPRAHTLNTGIIALRQLTDHAKLPHHLAKALHPSTGKHTINRGGLFTDLAISLATGATCLDDFETIHHTDHVLHPGATTTGSTTLLRQQLATFNATCSRNTHRAIAKTRQRVWSFLENTNGHLPASTVHGPHNVADGTIVIDIDATTVPVASDRKERSAGLWKGGHGFHPLTSWCDNTAEPLAFMLRPGNAGSNTAQDHIHILTQSLEVLPAKHRRHVLVRTDSAGGSKEFTSHLAECSTHSFRVEYSIGMAITAPVREAIALVEPSMWRPALTTSGTASVVSESAVAELTGLVTLCGWPGQMRLIVRRERLHPGAQLTVLLAVALMRWFQLVGLAGTELERCGPKKLRYRVLGVPGVVVRSGRRVFVRVAQSWPWVGEVVGAVGKVALLGRWRQ